MPILFGWLVDCVLCIIGMIKIWEPYKFYSLLVQFMNLTIVWSKTRGSAWHLKNWNVSIEVYLSFSPCGEFTFNLIWRFFTSAYSLISTLHVLFLLSDSPLSGITWKLFFKVTDWLPIFRCSRDLSKIFLKKCNVTEDIEYHTFSKI